MTTDLATGQFEKNGTFSTRLFARYQRNEKARVYHRVVSQDVLVLSAARGDGLREILGVEVADTESEATYQELFRSLKRRRYRRARQEQAESVGAKG